LGFALRSTNTRNAFEFFVPLVRIAQKVLKRETKLILSSEWDYSPFTYPFVFAELPNFVLIGLPASESENPLIIPLAGHELGHSVWKIYDLSSVFASALEGSVLKEIRSTWRKFEQLFSTNGDPNKLDTDLALWTIWSPAREWSRRQAEEIFCDAVGVRLFGESYFHAMEYLLSPHFQNRRAIHYPDIRTRVDAMSQAATRFGVPASADFWKKFTEKPLSLDAKQRYLLNVADHATKQAINDLVGAAGVIADKAGIPRPVSTEADRILECFEAGIPAHGLRNLADIINAGWRGYIGQTPAKSRAARGERFSRLADVILKTIEVMEFEIRTGTSSC
jgi:hypothetical protein